MRQGQEDSSTGQEERTAVQGTTGQPRWVPVLIITTGVLLAGLIIAPLSLSGQDIMDWARTGLALSGWWPWVVFYALDATAIISVLICVYSAWTGQRAGLFQLTVWAIAILSAYAQHQHGKRIAETAPDASWFFPLMALLSPFMLELVLARLRAVQRHRAGQTAQQMPKFGFWRWIPGIGSLTETYGAWRCARLLNLSEYNQAVQAYRQLCPSGGVRLLAAIRKQEYRTTPVLEAAVQEDNPKEDGSTGQGGVQVCSCPVLYSAPVQEQPALSTAQDKKTAVQDKDNEQYLQIIRATWPNEVPAGNQIRTKLGVNYNKSKKLLEAITEERNQ